MCCGDFLKGGLKGLIGIIVEAIELCDRFDQSCLAFNRLNQSQTMLFDRGVVQADNRNRADQQGRSGHDQEQLVKRLTLNHQVSAYLVNNSGLWYLERPDKPIRKTPMVENDALTQTSFSGVQHK